MADVTNTTVAENAAAPQKYQHPTVYLYRINNKLIRSGVSKTGKPYTRVAFGYPDADLYNGKEGLASIFLSDGDSVEPDVDYDTKEKLPGKSRVRLHGGTWTYQISYNKGGQRVTVKATAEQIRGIIIDERKKYAQAMEAQGQAAPAPASAPVQTAAPAPAPAQVTETPAPADEGFMDLPDQINDTLFQ